MVPISTRVQLFFDKSIDPVFDKVVQGRSRIIRIYSYVRFKKVDDHLTKPYPAIVDTGAYVSIIPHRIWGMCQVNLLGEYKMSGLIPKEECSAPVRVGDIIGQLVDPKTSTKEYKFMAYFAETDEFPLILGFREILEKVKICFDFSENNAWLEEK
ncbi:MAG: hypothetical protein JSW28_10500 [Thermoplasmata archaeon]|nr:MAG: hypothetical protein JSW28_10500 [Thermoplasmata archaeon]